MLGMLHCLTRRGVNESNCLPGETGQGMRESTAQLENTEVEEVVEEPGASHTFTDTAIRFYEGEGIGLLVAWPTVVRSVPLSMHTNLISDHPANPGTRPSIRHCG